MNVYEVRNVSREFRSPAGGVQALRDVNLDVERGEFTAIAGPSGSGKTTLLNILGLLDEPDCGTVCFEGQDVSQSPERRRTQLRREHIGFIFQALNLIPVLTALENVEYPLLTKRLPAEEARVRAEKALEAVGLTGRSDERAARLSGGERQRVAIARALARDVDVVLADEPTAALDQSNARAVMLLLQRLNRERGITFIFSSHDPHVLSAAGRVLPLADGRIAGEAAS